MREQIYNNTLIALKVICEDYMIDDFAIRDILECNTTFDEEEIDQIIELLNSTEEQEGV